MTESLTLAFTVEAISAVAEPAAAFDEARQWSTYVGFVTNGIDHRTVNELRDRGVYGEDFFVGTKTKHALARLRAEFETDRYVVVPRTTETTGIVGESAWESLTIKDAADAACWELRDPDEPHTVE